MFPAFGFLVNFCIPLAGIVLALVLLFIRPTRSLAAYACFVPMLGAWCAFAGLLAVSGLVATALYKTDPLHSHPVIFATSLIVGFGAGGILGSLAGVATAFGINRACRWLYQGMSKA
jgi:hypothetical protein